MEADAKDNDTAAQRYVDLLSKSIDVLLLGVGEDGHIVSLFPNSAVQQERKRQVVPNTVPKPPFKHLTITPQVITNELLVFVLVPGSTKELVLFTTLEAAKIYMQTPVRLTVKNATWLLDNPYTHEYNEQLT